MAKMAMAVVPSAERWQNGSQIDDMYSVNNGTTYTTVQYVLKCHSKNDAAIWPGGAH